MPPQFQDDEIDSFMRKRTATTPKPSPAPKPAPVADDDVDGFMSRRTGSVPTLTTKKEQKAQRREQLRQSITSLQDELVARTPQPQTPRFQSPIDMRLNAPNEAQKAFDRAAAATRPATQPKPRNAFQTPRPKPMLERVMAQQAIERQQPQTVEADPQRLEQLKQTTAQQLAEQRDVRVRQSRANVEQMSPLQRMAVRGLAKAGGATNEDIRAIAPPQGLEADLMRATNAGVRQVGSMVRGAGEALPGFLPPAVGALRKPIRQGTVGAAKNIQGGMEAVVDAAAPDDPADQSFRAKLGRGVGSVGASMGGALATGGGSLAAGTLGALGNLGQVAEERERSGVPVSGLREAGSDALAVATGMTEALGAGRLLNRLGMKTPVIQRVAQALEEGGQEYAQGYLNDINAKLVAAYDPNRAIDDPLSRKRLEEALIGTILGSAGEVADVSAQRAMAAQQNAQQRATRSAIDQRSAANAAAIAPQPAAAQPVTEPLTEPMAAQPQPSAPRTAPIQPQPTQPEGLPRLPARELSAQDKFAQAYGAKEPVENRINTMIGKAETLLGSQNENDRKMGERMMNRALTAIRQTEGYLAEAALPPDAPRPFTTVRDAIEARLKPAPKAPKGLNPEVQKSVDLAKQDAVEAEQAGNYEAAANHWKAAHSSLVAAQREIRRSGNAEQIKAIATDISIADANRRKAMQAARTAQRQANAPTADLVKTRNNIPEKYQTSQPVDSAPLLRPDAVQNPEGGIPQMPEQSPTAQIQEPNQNFDQIVADVDSQAALVQPKGTTEALTSTLYSNSDVRQRKQEIGKLIPFNIQGNKADLLAKGLGGLMERAAKGTKRTIDAFAGSGTYTHYLRSKGYANEGDVLNEYEPLRYIAHKQIRDNPEIVGKEAERTLNDLRALTANIREGETFAETHNAIRRQVTQYFRDRLSKLTAEGQDLEAKQRGGEPIEMQDSPETAGLYTIMQNQAFNFLPIQAELGGKGFKLPGFGVVGNERGKVGLFVRGKDQTFKASQRVVDAGSRFKGVDVRRGDGWELIGKEAGAGDLVPVDTSYLNKSEAQTTNYNKATQEDAIPQVYIEKVRKYLLPAWDRGAKLVITNNWDDGVANYLRSEGFKVLKAKRQGASAEDVRQGGAAELIAINFDKRSGQLFGRRGAAIPSEPTGRASEPTQQRRSDNANQATSASLDARTQSQDEAIRGRRNDGTIEDVDTDFQPDTADLREVREFGKRPPQTEQFTEEPPTAPLARRREPIRPPAPASPRQVGNRPLSVDVAGTRTPTAMSPEFPRARREMVKQGREVDALLKAKQEKGEFGNVAEAMFKSNTPDVLHGQDSFFHDPDLKGKLGLTREAEMADVRRELKTQLARSLGLSADEVSLSHIKPEVWRAWAKQKGLGREAVRKLEAGIARAERKQRATETNAAIVAEESQRAKEELRKPAAKAGKSIDAQVKQALDESGLTAQEKKAIFDEVGQPLLTYFPEDALASVNEQIASIYEQRAIRKKMQEDAAKRKATPAWQMTQAEFLATAPYLHGTNKKNAESIKAAGRIATGQPKNYSDPEFGDAVYFAKPDSHFHTKDFSEGNFDLSQKIPVEIKPDAKVLTWRSVEDIEATAKKIGYSSATQLVRDLQSDFETRSRDKAYVPDANTLKSVRAKNALRKAGYDVVEVDNPDSLTGSIEWRPDPRYAAMSLSGQQLVALNPNAVQLSSKMHEQSVRKALAEGKPVPAEVLADYPKLQKKPAAKAGKSIDAQIKDIRDLQKFDLIDDKEAKRKIAALEAQRPKIAERREAPGFFSQLERVIDAKMPAKASAAQVRAIIENPQSGVKPEEVKWTGLDDYLRGKETVTKADVQEFLKANQVDVQEVESGKKAYAQYTLPGAKEGSYRELLLTLPAREFNYRAKRTRDIFTPAEYAELTERERKMIGPFEKEPIAFQQYKSSHFDEPNILAHIRFNERTDADGKRVLHIEEIQSDWHQEGRKKGYKPDTSRAQKELDSLLAKDSLSDADAERIVDLRFELADAERASTNTVPDAPFKKTWHELAFKRALRWAAENGYERMTWTTGEQQADRFDLSKYVENISWQKNADGTYNILPTTKDRGVPGLMHQHASLSAVEDLLGKEIAAKIERGDGLEWEGSGVKQGTLQGVDLKVGGEGMKGFYDQILPAFANKYGRKWGVKVGTAKVQTAAEQKGTPEMFGENAPAAYRAANDLYAEDFPAKYETVHSIDITPAMRESVMQGQPKFRREASGAMPERYTGRQLFENAQLTFRPARNRPATLVANDWGGAMLNRLLSEKFDVTTTDANFTIGAKDAKDLRDYLAEAKDSGIYEPAQVANMDAMLRQMDAAIADAEANQQDVAFVTRRPAEPISATKAKIRHEAAHLSQSRIAADLSALTGKNWLDSQPNAAAIHKELDRRGYKPETHDYEAAAFVASGDYGVFGMDVNQAAKFLSDYFGAVVEKHGKRALQKFGAIDPKLQPTLEAARRETETRRTENQQRSFEAARGNERRIGAAGEAGGSRTSVRARRREGDTGTAEGADRSPRTRASVEGSPEFKRWFGDSKVVDESGKPLVVYHGTESDFDVFDEDKIRRPGYGFGFHFAESSGLAGAYSKQGYGANKNVMPVYLSIKNPFTGDYYQFAAEIGTSWPPEIAAELKKRGYDGIRYNHGEWSESKGQSPYAWVAFSPNQIKSAIGNRGTFDPASPRIIERREGTARGGFSFGRVPEGRGQVLASFPANIQNWLGQSKPKEADMPTKPEPVPAEWNQQKWARKAADALVTRDMPKEDREKFYDINTKKPERLALLQKYMPSEQDIDALTAVIDRANNAIKNNDGDNLREAVWAARAIVERPATNAEKASALMRAAMFSTPRGRLRDLISNFAEQKLATVARIPGSAADAAFTTLRRMLTGEGERTFLGPRPGEYLRHRAADRAKQWKQTKDAWKGKHVDALEDVLQHREVNFDNKFLDKTTKAVFRAMGAADQWFFVKEYQRAIREQAELAARADVRSGVIAKADRQKQTDYYAAAPTTEMKAMAELAAKQMVFRNPNFLSDKVFKPLRENLPPGANFALDIVMPVDRTPTNIILTALEYSPLGAVKLAGQMATGTVKATAKTLRNRKDLPTRQAIKKALDEAFPPEKQRAMSRLFGRTVTGTAAPVALGFALASAGLATGFYDEDDPGEEAERREEGKMPNSVKIGDRWYELSGIAPLGMLIGLGATLHREMHAETLDPEKRYARLAKGFGNMAMELPALESAKQTVKIAKAVTGKPSDLGRIAGNIGARFVPGLVSDIGQATPYLRDPYEREVKAPKSGEKDTASLATKAGREFAGEFGARIPGVRRLLPPKMNTLTGKPVETEWTDVIDPFRSRKAVEPGSLSGVKAAQMKFDISSEVRPKIGEPDEVFQQRKQRVEGWMQEYGDKLLSHPSYSLLTQAQQQAAMESLRRRIGAQQNAAQPKLGTLAPEKVIQSVLKSEATRPKRDAGKLWVSPATRP